MAYSALDEVKALLRITSSANDTEITTAITDFDVKIDNRLQNYESNLPLTPTPASINKASKFGAASLWLRLSPTSETQKELADVYEKIALEYLDEYIKETYDPNYVGLV